MWTLKLLKVNQMPSEFREPFIVSSYRSSRSSFICCLKSMFQNTNETLNFWTHFLPLLYFFWRFCAAFHLYNFMKDSYSWPLAVFQISICAYLLGSSFAHLFNCLSQYARHVCFFFDYAAISLYSLGAAVAYQYYVFPESMIGGMIYHVYLYIAAFNAIMCTVMACSSRIGNREKTKKIMRLLSFAVPYAYDAIPLLLRLTTCYIQDCWDESFAPHIRQFFCAAIVAFLFASHFPECMAPGRFDVWGHSHQLFHIFGALGTNDQLNAITWDMLNRREILAAYGATPTVFSSFGVFVFVLVANLLTVSIFSYMISHQETLWKYTGRLYFTTHASVQNATTNNNCNFKES
ncbi:membrane progestin receptor gamma-B-like [Glandiceps talaboti]